MNKLPLKLKKYTKRFALISFFALSFILLASASSSAQTTGGSRTVTISPPSVEVKVNPGDKKEGTLKVVNDSDEVLNFTVTTNDFVVDDTNGTPNILPINTLAPKFSAASWIGVFPGRFSVLPHDKQIISYFIQVPGDARPGGHYAAIIYKPDSTGSLAGSGASVNTLVGSIFYVTVNGPVTEKAFVSRFFSNAFQEYGPFNIFSQIQNNSDLHIRPKGSISLFNMLGQRVEIQGLSEFNIYPTAARDYQNKVGSTFMIGRYKAVLLASYGQNNNLPLAATLYFWVFPWKLALLIILIVVAIILASKYMRRRKGKGTGTAEEKPTQTSQEPINPQA